MKKVVLTAVAVVAGSIVFVGARAHGTSASASGKVGVQFYGEAGCPFCREFVAGPLNKTLSYSGVAAIMDFSFVPWGNEYFATEQCKGQESYDPTARECYNGACGAGAVNRPSDCFSGAKVCQHGGIECTANRYLACATTTAASPAPAGYPAYMPFVTCMEAAYDKQTSTEDLDSLARSCAEATSIDFGKIQSCFAGAAGDEAQIDQAKATPSHPGVPYVVVNGKALDDVSTLLQAVCAAYEGEHRPAACQDGPAAAAFAALEEIYA
mmetsp:Transcript_15322/g.34809  ORF Transcript_15322/g.34809 Transcript_15322/m.34809 type:complete len:267 (-) Transcript_15322:41-841(-)|eukprot:CAMPEP_0197932730 /NCGR_PEP_ID=MMETSP1439-20131203/109049_1 /TAXON_ID=66791 /ORGANISM="Gonyaulax spinifera, Strain CCMP409" /LENGTH=266 /DNA_ID=CAMNT_0043555529 /DNA_START=85 /DNA_END=885 /DNA_ORIENTATION=+